MCGIAGFADFKGRSDETILTRMADPISYRGPDDHGCYMYAGFRGTLGLVHRRLSIIDISSGGHQPMHFRDLTIVFNGEIYNYKELKKELEKEGHRFESSSDTEVILHAFDAWGVKAVHRFIGMFAFAILDRGSNKLYLFRDRAGVKPLYYFNGDNTFLFGSELKVFYDHPAFVKDIDQDAVAQFFLYGYITAPHSIFRNTYKLLPGHYLVLDLGNRQLKQEKYWDINDHFRKPKLRITEQDAIAETEALLKSAFDYRMVSDVPVGVFLSGGYDSSTLAAILQKDRTEKLKTFTVGFNHAAYNEADVAKQIAEYLGTDHTEYYCTEKEAEDILEKLPFFFDEPFSDPSSIPTILVSRMAREKVTVALSADGGDELFGGYSKYTSALNNLKKLERVPRFFRKPAGKLIHAYSPEYIPVLNKKFRFYHNYYSVGDLLRSPLYGDRILKLMSHRLNVRELRSLMRNEYSEKSSYYDHSGEIEFADPLDAMLAVDYKTYMVDNVLTKVDRATMSVSLEGREPLLDHRIAEFVAQLPSDLKIRNGQKKFLLKQINHKYLPKQLLDRPKMGFGIPIEQWFRGDLKGIFMHYLDPGRIKQQDIFNTTPLEKMKKSYLNGSNEYIEPLWSMVIFQLWFDQWIKGRN